MTSRRCRPRTVSSRVLQSIFPRASCPLFTLAVLAAGAASAATSPDRPAAIVVYPYVTVDPEAGVDTQVQLTNATAELIGVQCFYEHIETECVGGQAGQTCELPAPDCSGTCVTEPRRISFSFRVTARQPLAWLASAGLNQFPLDGIGQTGPGGQSNGTGSIPGLGPGPITVSLRCVVVDAESMVPEDNDALVGQATLRTRQSAPTPAADAAQYRAIGIRAISEVPNDNSTLHLGGAQAEYEGCSDFHLLEHFFAHAPLTTGDRTAVVDTTLVLASCASAPEETFDAFVQFVVFNEFAQRFSTARSVSGGYLVTPLDMIDTAKPTRSIFSLEVQGTLAGRTQFHSVGGPGLHVVAIETHRTRGDDAAHSAGLEVHATAERADGDLLVLDARICVGDCDLNGDVVISEVVTGIGIGIGQMPLARCEPIDANDDERVGIDEMVSSVASSIDGCAEVEPTLPPSPTPTPTPNDPVTSVGPDITLLGLATADDHPLVADLIDDEDRPVFVRPFGQGFTLLIEARPGISRRPVGGNTFSESGDAPDLQLLASNPLGNGDPEVCEDFGNRGGIPAVPDLEFALDDPSVVASMNDLGCRAYHRMASGSTSCTRAVSPTGILGLFDQVDPESTIQFCVPIARAWALPVGDTIFAARVRDQMGNLSEVRQMVVRVEE